MTSTGPPVARAGPGRPPTGTGGPGRGVAAAGLLGCLALSAAVWWPSLRVGFAGDDLQEILRAIGPGAGAGVGAAGDAPLFRPLALTSLRADHLVWGLRAPGFHVTALVLNGLTAWLVGLLAFRLWRGHGPVGATVGRTGSVAVLAAAWWCVWPTHGESVGWIGGRADLLATAGVVGALVCWTTASSPAHPDRRRWWVTAAVAALAVGLWSKESAAVAAPIAALWELTLAPRNPDGSGTWTGALGRVVRTWPLWIVTAVWWVIRAVVLTGRSGGTGAYAGSFTEGAPLGPVRRWAAVAVRALVPGLPWWGWALAVAGLVAVAATAAVAVATDRAADRGSVAPVVGFLLGSWALAAATGAGLGVSAFGSAGERLAHLSSVFAVTLLAGAVAVVGTRWRASGAVLGVTITLAAIAASAVVQTRWIEAGRVAGRLADDVGTLARDRPVVILTVPDERAGAWTGRNLVGAAMVLLHDRTDPERVWSATGFRHDGPLAVTVEPVTPAGPEPGGRTWRLRLDGPGARFTDRFDRTGDARDPAVEVRRVSDREVLVSVGPGAEVVAADASGRLRPA